MKFLNLSVESDCTTLSCEFNQDVMLTFTQNNGKGKYQSQLEVFAKEEEGGFGTPLFRKNYQFTPSLETIVTDIQNSLKTEGKRYWITVGKVKGLTSAITQINRNALRNPTHSDRLSTIREELSEERKHLMKKVKRHDVNSRSR